MRGFGLNPSACTVYLCRVCILAPSLHSTPCIRFTLTSAVYIFCPVRSLYSRHKENRLVLKIVFFLNIFSKTQRTPGARVFHKARRPLPRRPLPLAPAPRHPHPGIALSTKPAPEVSDLQQGFLLPKTS